MKRLLRWAGARRHLLALALVALLTALALRNPGVGGTAPRHEWLVIVDITQSMNVPDQHLPKAAGASVEALSRLALSRALLRSALNELPCESRLGIGIFSEYRSLLLITPVEVCAHRSELAGLIGRLDSRMAWAGNSEVAKGLYSGIGIAAALPSHPALVFLTDGHEAPPLSPRFRPVFNGERGAVAGALIGVGGSVPLPIPRTDPLGRPIGVWGADDVLQTDPRSFGRGGSVAGEAMVDGGEDAASSQTVPLPGATPGREHLSALREDYLRLLAGETGLRYARLETVPGLVTALTDPGLARTVPVRLPLAPWFAAAALVGLLLLYLREDLVRAQAWLGRQAQRLLQRGPRVSAATRPQR
ncbi:MxaL protein [Rivibacter subsaxonicus]|uniref:MxaL protein n=1 Tax=Rivibacter subsaxonicus TaxID=457575 RepID=A0A4Q7VAL9_9BURK|nr:MxaL protein [Rivibacter subsaxonicus]RZT93811.1 mxaL protein [Rivibacter subsaxonicus]